MMSSGVFQNARRQPIVRTLALHSDAFVHLVSSLGPAIRYKVNSARMEDFFTNWRNIRRDNAAMLGELGIYWTSNAETALEYLLRVAHALHWKTRNRIVKEMFGEGTGRQSDGQARWRSEHFHRGLRQSVDSTPSRGPEEWGHNHHP